MKEPTKGAIPLSRALRDASGLGARQIACAKRAARAAARQDFLGAIDAYTEAIALGLHHHRPPSARLHHERATMWYFLGDSQRACLGYRDALWIDPSIFEAHATLVMLEEMLPETTDKSAFARRKAWWDRIPEPRHRFSWWKNFTPDPMRPLRIGFVASQEIGVHSAAYLFASVLLQDTQGEFEKFIFCSIPPADPLALGWKQTLGNHFVDTSSLTDRRVAQMIADRKIDILVDCTGWSLGMRLGAFRLKPSPIQVHAWGNLTGTGLPEMDYILTDDALSPESAQPWYTERFCRLPAALGWCPPYYLRRTAKDTVAPALEDFFVAPVDEPPSAAGRPFTYGCFNRVLKISDWNIEAWSHILDRVEGARLLIKDSSLSVRQTRERLLDRFPPAIRPRIEVLGESRSHGQHLAAMNQVDVMLDPWPHGGGTSTLEALWMGVPVITRSCERTPSRLSSSSLIACGTPDWITRTPADYEEVAVQAASSSPNIRDMLTTYRQSLRAQIMRSDMWETKYPTHVYRAFRGMWKRWCGAPAGTRNDPRGAHHKKTSRVMQEVEP